jgi:flagellar biogenesis protein FliO
MGYVLELLKLVLILSLFAFASFYIVKKLKKLQFSQMSQNNIIQMIDGVQVSLGQNIYLTKVGEEYIVVAISSGGTSMIKLDQKEIADPKEQFDELFKLEEPNIALKTFSKNMRERLWKK